MVAELLVEVPPELAAPWLEAGWKLLDSLDKAGVPVEAAFWRFDATGPRWKLYLATPLVEMQGAFKTYAAINAVSDALPEEFRDVFFYNGYAAVETHYRLVKELRRIYGSIDGPRGRRDRVTSLQEDVFIYRL